MQRIPGYFTYVITVCCLFPLFRLLWLCFRAKPDPDAHQNWLGRRGTSIKIEEVKKTGFKAFSLGIILWIAIGVLSLVWITEVF